MITNYFKTAFRHIEKNKLITAINILSLSIGICATLVIFLMIRYDYSFDKHLPHGDRVYRVVSDGGFKSPAVLVPLVRTMEEEVSGLEAVAPLFQIHDAKIKAEQKGQKGQDNLRVFPKEEGLIFTNKNYFTIYPHQWLAGNVQYLTQPNQVVLSEAYFQRYFPQTPVTESIGKTILYADSIPLQIAGVVAEMKENSDFKYNGYISTATISASESLKKFHSWDSWGNYNDSYQCLVLLSLGTKPATVEKSIAKVVSRHAKAPAGTPKDQFALQPLNDVHFNTEFNYEAVKPATLRNLVLLAVFLLALGAINFINLSTAQSIERAKEIGVRKTLGSKKSSLIGQFLMETLVVAGFATLLSVLLLPILLHAFEGFMPKGFSANSIPLLPTVAFLLIQLIIVTLLAGFYPAWIMTGYAPILALKNQVSGNSNLSRSAWIRKGLTLFQFVLAQVFLIAVLFVSKQINFATQMDMGFRKDAIINFYIPDFNRANKGDVLKNKLMEIPEIKAVSFGNQSPAFQGSMYSRFHYDASLKEDKQLSFDIRHGDENYIHVYDIPLVAGRNVRVLDSTYEALVNEKMLPLMEVDSPEEAIGKTFNDGKYTVVGVMKDFNIASAHHEIRPAMYWSRKGGYVMHVALDQMHPTTWKAGIAKMEKAFLEVYPEEPFEYRFLDETIQGFYQTELKLSKLLNWAVGLSITIASLGLFGLALFTANQRTKEIGIRKVLGASVAQIIILLTKNLVSLVVVACLIAIPVAYYFMHKWLEDFAYKTPLNWWVFAVAAMGLLIVAVAVLAAKTFYAARANPVHSLRDE
ncbi:ABC transporter permease [Parapedobacter sp. ISTM3]|uniref:ABC transporter permease n=1 Tax=Parapedobacter sp. ISTM3 TaxID=2800130 RepID=UPI0019030739|nr:ABC transporter permease [Parapedobacter sp. ISTM3]MBK1441200.1 ABC transporter permease [Parapedobacter sp. ISTM3]